MSVLFFLSSTSFCCGIEGDVRSCIIPLSLQKQSKLLFKYYPPLSVLNDLILQLSKFSTPALKFLNLSKVSSFVLSKRRYEYLDKSSIKVIKYLLPPIVILPLKSQTSE
jgi:hypothetical protein